ncbi:C40 family peptidase [Trueperella bernardiae]|uniref:C40 family peptidase n=1 Tax=Trueperella bernardiae TaxID=59561 RepID=UPI000837B6C2|nr:C40 family peptidase [Trueperella bernardiae]MCM3908085.1 C40 family peptidase [Trueperella bernardiae]WIM08043.1 C40 family peptidase [Trueperella bernardiae]
MASRHDMIAPRSTFSKSTVTAVATASTAGVLMGIGSPMALADGNASAAQASKASIELATSATTTNPVATVDLGTVSVGEWEMETVTVEAEGAPVAAAPVEATAQTATAEARTTSDTAQATPAAGAEPVQQAYSGSASSVAATALAYQGAPYRWGGTTPAGWDCIGFVRYVYAQHGVHIGGYTTSVLSVGYQVPYSEARAGDILYWPGHVAISLGNGMNVGAWNESMGTTTGSDASIGIPTVIRVF